MRLRLLSLTAGALALSIAGCGGGGGGSSSGGGSNPIPPNTVRVGGSTYGGGDSMAFTPSNLTVTAGTTVTWTFLSGPHNVTSGSGGVSDGKFTSGASQSSGTYTHLFDTAGSYPYFCSVHGVMMSGTITVN